MKVVKVEAFPVDLRYEPGREFLVSYGVIDAMQNAIIRVTTDDGLVGYGELMPLPLDSRDVRIAEMKNLAPAVIGQDPFNLREIHARMDEVFGGDLESFEFLQKGAIDFALHDIMGKAAGVPVYKLLGGSYDDGVPMHFSISIRSPEEMGQDTAARVAEGYKTIEVKLGRFRGELELETEIARIKAIREAAGPDVIIVADPNTGWTVAEAIEVLPMIEEFDVYVEQPVAGLDDLGESARCHQITGHRGRERRYGEGRGRDHPNRGGRHDQPQDPSYRRPVRGVQDARHVRGSRPGLPARQRDPNATGVDDDDPLLDDVPAWSS